MNPQTRRQATYALIGSGLVVGLAVFLLEPLASTWQNQFVGGVLLTAAVVGVTHLIVSGSDPGKRGPEF